MKFTITLLLILSCFIITISPSYACYIEDKPTSEYYYWGSTDTITIHNCTATYNYSLTFGTNLKESERIQYNWTAIHGSYIIEFKQTNEPINDSRIIMPQLQISLYENNILKDTTYRTIMLYNDQWDMGLLTEIFTITFIAIIIGSLMIAIATAYVKK